MLKRGLLRRGFILPLTFIARIALAEPSPAPAHTIYSDISIPEKCASTYLKGEKAFEEAVTSGIREKGERAFSDFLDKKLADLPEEEGCEFFFSMGVFDAQGTFHQRLVLEYLLEMDSVERDPAKETAQNDIRAFFATRFQSAGMPAATVDQFAPHTQLGEQTREGFIRQMNETALKAHAAIPFGRFVFVSITGSRPFTLYEHDRTSDGHIHFALPQDIEKHNRGSYQRAAEKVWNDTRALLEAYLRWRPGIFFGEDSFLYGSFWKAIGWDKTKTIRELKEENFVQLMRMYVGFAHSLNLDLAPFLKLQDLLLKKQRALLDRDLSSLDFAFKGVCAAPLIPVGM